MKILLFSLSWLVILVTATPALSVENEQSLFYFDLFKADTKKSPEEPWRLDRMRKRQNRDTPLLSSAPLVPDTMGSSQQGEQAAYDPSTPPPPQLSAMREHYIAAEKALKRNDMVRFRQLEKKLLDYPLYPYLAFQLIKKNLSRQSHITIQLFLSQYFDTPLANKLRVAWLLHLARKNDARQFMQFYRPGLGSRLTCRYADFQQVTGSSMDAIDASLRSIWFTGKSLPAACNTIIDKWRQSGYLTANDIWQRLGLAIKGGQTRLARYLSSLLPKEQRYLGKLWIRLRARPERVVSAAQRSQRSGKESELFSYAIQRLAWRDVDKAMSTWQKVKSKRSFSGLQQQKIHEAITINLVHDNHKDAEAWLSTLPESLTSPKINEWRLRYALWHQDWDQVSYWLATTSDWGNSFPTSGIDYWRARADAHLGKVENAQQQLATIAEKRNYYGFLASFILGVPPSFTHEATQVESHTFDKVTHLPAVLRAKELFAINKLVDARREWFFLKKGLSREELKAAAVIADSLDWHDRAILTLAKAKDFNDIDIRFPLAFKDELMAASSKFNVQTSWSYAIIRQESAFMQDARSHVGATGLMQLMPYTAKSLARKMRIRYRGRYELLKPQRNINYGTYYLNRLTKRYKGNKVYATASYNAGPHRVRQWLPESDMPLDIWIENIPFNETRKYVKRVLTYQVIYSEKLNETQRFIAESVIPENMLQTDVEQQVAAYTEQKPAQATSSAQHSDKPHEQNETIGVSE